MNNNSYENNVVLAGRVILFACAIWILIILLTACGTDQQERTADAIEAQAKQDLLFFYADLLREDPEKGDDILCRPALAFNNNGYALLDDEAFTKFLVEGGYDLEEAEVMAEAALQFCGIVD